MCTDELELLLGLEVHAQIFLLKFVVHSVVTWLFQSKAGASGFMHLSLRVNEYYFFRNKHIMNFSREELKKHLILKLTSVFIKTV